MTNISIVTAFFDIGRGSWTPDKGLPHYLHRTTDTYFERFSYLAEMENDIVVFTTENFYERILKLRGNKKTDIVVLPLENFHEIREKISKVQNNPKYQSLISPYQIRNPEYWSPDYVLVNYLKSTFVNIAMSKGLIRNNLISWMDFGYCRSPDKVPPSKKWSYDFDVNKMHLFKYKDFQNGDNLTRIIASNDVYIHGGLFLGGLGPWIDFKNLMQISFDKLIEHDLIDDDQTLMLMSTLFSPTLFEIYKIPDNQVGLDSFVILKDFNNEYDI